MTTASVRKILDSWADLPTPEPSKAVVTAPSYSRAVFDERLPKVASWAAQEARNQNVQAIVAAGHSGLVLAGAVSLLSGVPVFAVRKRGEENLTHDVGNMVNAVAPNGPVERWAFLDDFIASGETLRWSSLKVYQRGLVRCPYPDVMLAYTSTTYSHPVFSGPDEAWGEVRRATPEFPWPEKLFTIPVIGRPD